MVYVAMYLAAIVAANLTTATFGPSWSVINAFAFIGLNLTARDKLHDAWQERHLLRNMAGLILAGSALTVLVNGNASRIAIASTLAFASAEAVDALVYHGLKERRHLVRVNGSNVPSAFVDSLVFPLVAFGWSPLWGVMVGQFIAKVFGGFVWSVMLETTYKRLRQSHS